MFLVAQSTYDRIELGIYQDNLTGNSSCLKSTSIDKLDATKLLISELDKLLDNLKIRLSNLDFIAVSRGPAPFTTLRVLLSTINGIALATQIPLIGIDSLEALLKDNLSKEYKFTLAILNAFSDDVYYALQTPKETKMGCKNINDLMEAIKIIIENEKIEIIGNGIEVFKEQIKNLDFVVPKNNPQYTTLQEVADAALKKWHNKETQTKILPIYLKEAVKN